MSTSTTQSSQDCLFNYWAESRPNQIALIHGTCQYHWKDVQDTTAAVARYLGQHGLVKGDTLVVLGKNHPHHLWLFLAAMMLDIRVSFIASSPVSVIRNKLRQLVQSDQQLWLYDQGTHCIDEFPYVQSLKPVLELQSSISLAPTHSCVSDYDATHLATLTFTSGSMGNPKVVAHSHQQHYASADGLLHHFSFTPMDCWLLSLPLYHVSGLAIVYRWLQVGACLKVGNGNLEQEIVGVTHASLVPVQLARLLDNPSLSLNLTHVLLGGSHIPPALCQRAEKRSIETWLGYGMTEAASTVTAKRADSQVGVGAVLPRRSLIVEGARILVAGDTLALGYYNCGHLTPLVDNRGWYDSGDLGEWRDGELVILGRADNMFVSGGENIHCEEIEAALVAIPLIRVAVVLAVMDKEYGARPVAFIDCGQQPIDRCYIEQSLALALDKYKWPIDYFALPDSIFNQGIKVSRYHVKEWFNTQQTQYLVMR
ncbi:o-succinylbenzoate--CoA ligase [Vibrio sp. WJH972]